MDSISRGPHGPLSYPSQKCVLEHLEANKRFLTAIHCPSLRVIEKQIPLHIDYLHLTEISTRFNETSYMLGIYRHFPAGSQTPIFFKNINDDGGAHYDLDRFGREDWEPVNVLTPGDIPTSNPQPNWQNYQGAYWEQYIRNNHIRLIELSNMEETSQTRQEKDKLRAIVYSDEFVEFGASVPFDMYLQFTVLQEPKRRELMVYATKRHEAQKYLMTKLLGGRELPIRVRTLDISGESLVLRLPLGVKFRIEKFHTNAHLDHMMDFPIFDPRSFPLHTIQIRGNSPFEFVENHYHPVIQNARNVFLWPKNGNFDWFSIVSKYRTQSHVQLRECNFSVAQYTAIVDMIIRDHREIGTRFSFITTKLAVLEEVMVALRQRGQQEKRQVFLPMRTAAELRVFFDKVQNATDDWALVIDVVVKEREGPYIFCALSYFVRFFAFYQLVLNKRK